MKNDAAGCTNPDPGDVVTASPGLDSFDKRLPPEILAQLKAALLSPDDVLNGRYRVIHLLGIGTVGAVYLVHDDVVDAEKAIKVVLPSLLADGASRERFKRVCRISQQLTHPAVARVYDIDSGVDRNVLFLTEEYVYGQSLDEALAENGGMMDPAEALELTALICQGLSHVHEHTNHLGIKPKNVFLSPDGGVKLLDTALASMMSPVQLRRRNAALGTSAYLAPEQLEPNREVSQRTDIYAVGVLLYQMLTGDLPVGRFDTPSVLRRTVPKAADRLVLRCLAQRPEDRPCSADEVLRECEKILKAPPRRKRFVLAAAALAFVAGVGSWSAIAHQEPIRDLLGVQTVDAKAASLDTAVAEKVDAAPLEEAGETESPVETAHTPEPETAATAPQPHRPWQRHSAGELNVAWREAKATAVRTDAETWAPERYDDAAWASWRAVFGSAGEDEFRASLYEATEALKNANVEAIAEKESLANMRRLEAEMALGQVELELVKAYAPDELAATRQRLARANDMRSDPIAMASLYEQVAVEFQQLNELARERRAQVTAELTGVRNQISELRDSLSPIHRKYGAAMIQEAENALHDALSAGDDHRSALNRYREARAHFQAALDNGLPDAGTEQIFLDTPFVYIPPGRFTMGANNDESGRSEPAHEVTLTRGYWMAKHEVTKAHWKRVMGTEPWRDRAGVLDDPNTPAIYVSYEDAQAFVRKLNAEGDGVYRLPTEAEWEYACRAGTDSAYSFGDDPQLLAQFGWFRANAANVDESFAHPVGLKRPNAWGLFDMHGNVWEWCEDWYGEFTGETQEDPAGPGAGTRRVERGGGWSSGATDCSSTSRYSYVPDDRYANVGFRIVRDL